MDLREKKTPKVNYIQIELEKKIDVLKRNLVCIVEF